MEIKSLNCLTPEALDTLLLSLPFYKQVKQESRAQYDLLLSYSRLLTFEPGETLLEEGRRDHWLYFLLRGQLAVLSGSLSGPRYTVNYITPGEVFGDFSVVLNEPRTASVVADSYCKSVLVFGTDFSVFGELCDFSSISLASKLIYFRNMVHNLRWKLEVYRITYPEQGFANEHRKVSLFTGKKNTADELTSLHWQACSLAKLLVRWNSAFQNQVIHEPKTLNGPSLFKVSQDFGVD